MHSSLASTPFTLWVTPRWRSRSYRLALKIDFQGLHRQMLRTHKGKPSEYKSRGVAIASKSTFIGRPPRIVTAGLRELPWEGRGAPLAQGHAGRPRPQPLLWDGEMGRAWQALGQTLAWNSRLRHPRGHGPRQPRQPHPRWGITRGRPRGPKNEMFAESLQSGCVLLTFIRGASMVIMVHWKW